MLLVIFSYRQDNILQCSMFLAGSHRLTRLDWITKQMVPMRTFNHSLSQIHNHNSFLVVKCKTCLVMSLGELKLLVAIIGRYVQKFFCWGEALLPLFWTSGDVCHVGPHTCMLCCLRFTPGATPADLFSARMATKSPFLKQKRTCLSEYLRRFCNAAELMLLFFSWFMNIDFNKYVPCPTQGAWSC